MIKELYSISNKTVYFKKSFVEEFRKSAADAKLLEFKKRLIAILEEKEREEEENFQSINKAFQVNEIFKSLTAPFRFIEKGGRVGEIGEIRTWNGKKYKKMPNKEWARVYDEETRGAKLAVAALKKKIDACTNSQELLNLVLANKERFCDNLGRPLPIVQELSKYVSAKNDSIESSENKKQDKAKKKVSGGDGGDKPPKVNRFVSQNPNARLVSDITDIEKKEIIDNLKKPVASVEHGIITKNENESVMTVAGKYVEEHFKDPAKTKIGDVEISKKGMKNDLSHGFGKDKLDAIPALKDVLEKGAYIGYANDSEGRPVNHHYFAGKVHFPDGDKIVFCRVHENKGDKINHFYVHEVFLEDDLKKEKDFLQDRATPMVGKRGEIPFIQSVLQEVLNVNENVKKSYSAVVGELKKSLFEGLEMNDD